LNEECDVNGYQITFYIEQNQRHGGQPLGDWLIGLARELHLRGATLQSAVEGFGRSGRIHSAHFVELADQPLEFITIVTPEEAERLFERLRAEQVKLFYVKAPVEFGALP
jgi:PII-like signaling protein